MRYITKFFIFTIKNYSNLSYNGETWKTLAIILETFNSHAVSKATTKVRWQNKINDAKNHFFSYFLKHIFYISK